MGTGAELVAPEILAAETLGAMEAGFGTALASEAVPAAVATTAGAAETAAGLGTLGEGFVGDLPLAEGVFSAAGSALPAAAETAAATAPTTLGDYGAATGFGAPGTAYQTGIGGGIADVSGLPYAASTAAAAEPGVMEQLTQAFEQYPWLKYTPSLATAGLGAVQAQGIQKQAGKLRRELGALPGATAAQQTGQEMVTAAQAGQLPPGADAQVQQFRDRQLANLEQYFARSGGLDSSSRAAMRNQVEQQVANYRESLRGQYLTQGLNLMGVSDQATRQAIMAGYQADVNAANLMGQYAKAAASMIPSSTSTATKTP